MADNNFEKLKSLTPEAQEAIRAILDSATKQFPNQSFIVAQGRRTPAEQEALYAQGPGTTKTRRGAHVEGRAADIYPLINNQIASYEQLPSVYDYIGQQVTGAGMTWGGTPGWGGPEGDYGHIQYNNLSNVDFKQAFAAARKAGKKTFIWQGKLYNTEMAE